MGLIFKVTPEGRAALRNEAGDGSRSVRVVAVGVSDIAITAGAPLISEHKRIATIAGGATAPDTIHVTASDSSDDVYAVRSFALFLDDGTLFASYGQPNVMVEKAAPSTMQLAFDAQFTDIDAASITFGDTNFMNPAATEETLGVVKFATDDQTRTATDRRRAMTPAGTKLAMDVRLGEEAPTDFTRQLLATTEAAAARGLLGLKSATLLLPAGVMLAFAGAAPPQGTLVMNGAAVGRSAYPELFQAIGTRFGEGDGVSTFNLPNVREGETLVAAQTAMLVGASTSGNVIAHAHDATVEAIPDHTHASSMGGAGSHGHGASTAGAGGHSHGAWTDVQGAHTHNGWTDGQGSHQHWGATDWQGVHSHVTLNNVFGDGSGSNYVGGGGPAFKSQQRQTNDAGGHAHNFVTDVQGNHAHAVGTDVQGNHGHNVGVGGVDHHAHGVSIAAVGDHTHPLSIDDAGGHAHPVSIASTGGAQNLAAGMYALFCITY